MTKRESQTQTPAEERSENVTASPGLKSANEGRSSSDNLGLLLERLRRRRQQMQFSGYRSANSPSAELARGAVTSCPFPTSGSDSDFPVEVIKRTRARTGVDTKEEEVVNKGEEVVDKEEEIVTEEEEVINKDEKVVNKKEEGRGDAEKIVNDLMARYTTVFEK